MSFVVFGAVGLTLMTTEEKQLTKAASLMEELLDKLEISQDK